VTDRATGADRRVSAGQARRYRRRLLVAAVCALAAVLVVAVVGPRNLGRQIEISFVRQPTRYAELYFEDPRQLPPASAADQPSTVRFTVRNHGVGVTRYRYVASLAVGGRTVDLAVGGRTVDLAEDTLALDDGQAQSREVTVPPVGPGMTYRVSVALTGTTDSIDFEGTT
jgi:hypothetical protein